MGSNQNKLNLEYLETESIKPNPKNAKIHGKGSIQANLCQVLVSISNSPIHSYKMCYEIINLLKLINLRSMQLN